MNNTELNRLLVKRGLMLRAAKRSDEAAKRAEAARDAAMDAAERAMLREIDFKRKWRQIEQAVELAAERNLEQDNYRKATNRVQAKKQAEKRRTFLRRSAASLGSAFLIGFLYAVNGVALWVAAIGITMACLFFILNSIAYITRNQKRQ